MEYFNRTSQFMKKYAHDCFEYQFTVPNCTGTKYAIDTYFGEPNEEPFICDNCK